MHFWQRQLEFTLSMRTGNGLPRQPSRGKPHRRPAADVNKARRIRSAQGGEGQFIVLPVKVMAACRGRCLTPGTHNGRGAGFWLVAVAEQSKAEGSKGGSLPRSRCPQWPVENSQNSGWEAVQGPQRPRSWDAGAGSCPGPEPLLHGGVSFRLAEPPECWRTALPQVHGGSVLSPVLPSADGTACPGGRGVLGQCAEGSLCAGATLFAALAFRTNREALTLCRPAGNEYLFRP